MSTAVLLAAVALVDVVLLAVAVVLHRQALLRAVGELPAPALVAPAGVLAAGAVGVLFQSQLRDMPLVSARDIIAEANFERGFALIGISSAALFVGVISVRLLHAAGTSRERPIGHRAGRERVRRAVPTGLLERSHLYVLTVLAACIVIAGPAALLQRPTYQLAPTSDVAFQIVEIATLPLAAAIGALYSLEQHRRRILGACLVVLTLYLVALGSRTLALLPVLLAGGSQLAAQLSGTGRRPSLPSLVALGVVVLVTLQIPLQLRSSDEHGLIPYGRRLLSGEIGISPGRVGPSLGNIGFSVPLADYVANRAPERPVPHLATSLNPLPGRFTNWSEVSPELRVNPATPYSAVGELASHGIHVLMIFCAMAGATIHVAAIAVARLPGRLRLAATTALTFLSLYFALLFVQYNLRSSTRIVLYIAVIAVLSVLIPRRLLLSDALAPWRPTK